MDEWYGKPLSGPCGDNCWAEEVFPRKHEILAKKKHRRLSQGQKETVWWYPQCGESRLDVFQNIRPSLQWAIQWYREMSYQAMRR